MKTDHPRVVLVTGDLESPHTIMVHSVNNTLLVSIVKDRKGTSTTPGWSVFNGKKTDGPSVYSDEVRNKYHPDLYQDTRDFLLHMLCCSDICSKWINVCEEKIFILLKGKMFVGNTLRNCSFVIVQKRYKIYNSSCHSTWKGRNMTQVSRVTMEILRVKNFTI